MDRGRALGRRGATPCPGESWGRESAPGGLTIGQLSAHTGVGAKAIRYYESIGLLPRPPRGANRYRRYGPADVIRVTLLRRMRLLGIPLASARPLLAGVSDARCAEVRDELLALVDKRLAALDREIAELCLLRAQVGRYQRALAGCRPEGDEAFSACRDVSCLALSDGASARLEEDDASCDWLCECL